MRDFLFEYGDLIKVVIVAIFVLAVLVSLSLAVNSFGCARLAEEMRLSTRYDPVVGCLLEVEPGKWIPQDSYYYREGR